jgi:glycosyltransferase involved in cell wall biosynthesis
MSLQGLNGDQAVPDGVAHAAAVGAAGGAAHAPRLSVAIITLNEAHRIGACLAALSFADEIVVLDSGSTDRTVTIARDLGAIVVQREGWPGFGAQKNAALALTRGEWVLSIDADEIVTEALARSIRQAITSARYDGWWVRRSSLFCGRRIRFGDWRNDRVLRLFRKSAGRFSDDLVHERVLVPSPHGKLDGVLLHDTVQTLDDARSKMVRYAQAGAERLRARGRGGLGAAWSHASWCFVRGWLLRAGFLDGWRGLVIAWFNARGTFLRYRWAAQPPASRPVKNAA